MFGAGLIKLRGDPCWWELTCLEYHYETQPIPNPISWYLHQAPSWFHMLGVAFNHLVELVAPFLIFGPRRVRMIGGLSIAIFQVLLIVSGNLSWLNHLTLALCLACFDDDHWRQLLPARFSRARFSLRPRLRGGGHDIIADDGPAGRPSARRLIRYGLVLVVVYLSIDPVANMVSSRQLMNSSFDPFRIVNTYGAFGSVGKVRREVILEGTLDKVLSESTQWREYEFDCKPGDPGRAPCFVSPYHHRLDWQIWFAAMSDYRTQPWLVHLVYKLLIGDAEVGGLLARLPFGEQPPTYIRAVLYEYRFTDFDDASDNWWQRQRVREYLPPLAADNPSLIGVLRSFGWPVRTAARRPH